MIVVAYPDQWCGNVGITSVSKSPEMTVLSGSTGSGQDLPLFADENAQRQCNFGLRIR